MKNSFLKDQNTAISQLQFELAGLIYGYDIQAIYNGLFKSGLDNNTMGFWVWDLRNEEEIYSPKFRKSLGYIDEKDFPNKPKSWMDSIDPICLVSATNAYNKHVETKGEYEYNQKVKYYKKCGDLIDLFCHGKVVLWDGDEPLVMIGVHMDSSGLYTSTVEKFRSKLNKDVKLEEMLTFEIGVWVEIEKGVLFKMQEKGVDFFKGICKMKKGAILYIHHHSDFDEDFYCSKGSITDLISKIILNKGDSHRFKINEDHYIMCTSECELTIKGIINKNVA